jgi:glycosyltransferase involved in cell wall biosynthesis
MIAPGADRPGILLIGNYPPPFGGVPRHLQDLAPYLARVGWNVHVLSGGSGGVVETDGVRVHRDGRGAALRRAGTAGFLARAMLDGRLAGAAAAAQLVPLRIWLSYMTRVSLAARIVERQRIRLVAAYNLASGAPVGALVSAMYDLPLVVMNFGEAYSHTDLLERIRPMVERIVAQAKALLAQTRHCAESYNLLGLSPPVQVIPIGINLEPFATLPPRAVAAASFGLPPEAPVVAFVGRMVPDMGLHTLLAAVGRVFERAPQTCFLIAGGRGELTADALAVAQRWPGRVAVAADVPDARLPSVYAAATVVAVPTRGARACGSLAAAEAMAARRPVVASAVGGIPEYVDDGVTGRLVPPENADALARALVELLADDGLARRYGEAAYRRMLDLFDVRRTNPRFETVFRRAAGLA